MSNARIEVTKNSSIRLSSNLCQASVFSESAHVLGQEREDAEPEKSTFGVCRASHCPYECGDVRIPEIAMGTMAIATEYLLAMLQAEVGQNGSLQSAD